METSAQGKRAIIAGIPLALLALATAGDLPLAASSDPPESGPIRIVGKKHYQTISAAISAARDGDVIEISAGDYDNVSVALSANNVSVRGVGGRPRLNGGGKSSNGKGLLCVQGSNTTLDNLELFGEDLHLDAENAWNQGAIFFEGKDLHLRNLYIHDNAQGMFTNGNVGTVDIRNSEFARNGEGGGHSHNLYINHNVEKLVMRGVWSHDCNGGHILKSRAFESDVQGCMFTDTKGTSLNWFIDFPNAGNLTFAGNVVQAGPNASLLIAYGEDPNPINAGKSVRIDQNTFVNQGRGKFFQFLNNGSPTYSGNIYSGPNAPSGGDNRTVKTTDLVSPGSFNYRLRRPVSGTPALAQYGYVHPATFTARKDNVYGANPVDTSGLPGAIK